MAVDSSGNLYIADTFNHRIRKVTPTGVITTVAGNGTYGYNGDGQQATNAQLYFPGGVAVDSSGNLYIADQGNERIRKVNPAGVISTVAGNGMRAYSGDGYAATSAALNSPESIAIDGSGNLYIADQGNNRIRLVTPAGLIFTVAGNGTGAFSGDGGPATSAELNSPESVAIDRYGNLYIADLLNSRIRMVDTYGTIGTVAGIGTAFGSGGYSGDGGQATSASLFYPNGIAVDGSGNLYIADTDNARIRKVNPAGVIYTVAGNGTTNGQGAGAYGGDGGPATSGELNFPVGVAVDSSGNFYIADRYNGRIRKVTY